MRTIHNIVRLLQVAASRSGAQHYGTQASRFLDNRVALVTGSTSGIGLAIAKSLSSRGCSVILNGFGEEDEIAALKHEFATDSKVRADYVYADLTNVNDIEKMCKEIKGLHPSGVDIIVNNAGFQFVRPVEEFPVDKWEAMIAVMLSAPFHLTRLLVPDMKTKGWGRIINVSSAHGLVASANKTAYVAAKHGLIGLSKVVALETAGNGVTCNALCPGYVDTTILQAQIRTLSEHDGISYIEAESKFLSNFHATKKAVGANQLGETVVFLCSDAASQMTGSSLVIDGGWTSK